MIKAKMSVLIASLLMTVVFAYSVYAAEYKNAELGFSITYPDNLDKQSPPSNVTVLFAISPTKMPWITASIVEGATIEAAFKASFENASDYSDIEIKGVTDTTTDSGIKGKTGQIKYMYQSTYECEGVVLGAQKNGKWIIVALATVPMYDSSYSADAFLKILKSLKFD